MLSSSKKWNTLWKYKAIIYTLYRPYFFSCAQYVTFTSLSWVDLHTVHLCPQCNQSGVDLCQLGGVLLMDTRKTGRGDSGRTTTSAVSDKLNPSLIKYYSLWKLTTLLHKLFSGKTNVLHDLSYLARLRQHILLTPSAATLPIIWIGVYGVKRRRHRGFNKLAAYSSEGFYSPSSSELSLGNPALAVKLRGSTWVIVHCRLSCG